MKNSIRITLCVIGLWCAFSQAVELKPGENYVDVLRYFSRIDDHAPGKFQALDALLRRDCPSIQIPGPEASLFERACAFPTAASLYTEVLREFRAYSGAKFDSIQDVIFPPRFTDLHLRSGSWNVNPVEAERWAYESATKVVRYLIAQKMIQSAFVDMADHFERLNPDPAATFRSLIRPGLAAWLASKSPLERNLALIQQMHCLPQAMACQWVRAELAGWTQELIQELTPMMTSLKVMGSQEQQDLRARDLLRIYEMDRSFQTWSQKSWIELARLLQNEEALSENAELSAYVQALAQQALIRQGLMGGPYSMVDEWVSLILLGQFQRLQTELGAYRTLAENAELQGLEVGPETWARFEEFKQRVLLQMRPYLRGMEGLREALKSSAVP